MCRLLYVNNPKLLESYGITEDKLKELLQRLEIANGGHGNGVGGLMRNWKFLIRKGLGYEVEMATEDILTRKWMNGVIFHTRLASSGEIISMLCHPFIDRWSQVILAHNGHVVNARTLLNTLKDYDKYFEKFKIGSYYCYTYVRGVGYVAKYEYYNGKNNVSDTWVATNYLGLLVRDVGEVEDAVRIFRNVVKNGGNFIIQGYDGTVYIIIDSRDIEIYNDDKLVLIASQFVSDYLGEENTYTADSALLKVEDGRLEVLEGELKKPKKGVVDRLKGWWYGYRYYRSYNIPDIDDEEDEREVRADSDLWKGGHDSYDEWMKMWTEDEELDYR